MLHLKKPNTIVITRFPYESAWGGEESHTLTLARHFRDQGYEVVFLGNCAVLMEKFHEEGFAVKKVNGGKMIVTPKLLLGSFLLAPFWRWNMQRAFENLMKSHEIKALYCHSLNEKLFLTPLALKKGIPVTWVEHQEIRNWLLKSPWKRSYKRYAKRVKIIPISPQNKRILKNQLAVSPKNIADIVHGIALEEILALKRQTQKGLIVAANRLIPKKGMMDILEAFQILLKQVPDLKLILIGEGEEKNRIQAHIQNLALGDKITLFSPLKKEEWYSILSRADVYVSAARDTNETFSLNTAEAMAAGCKVVVTDCSGIAYYLKNAEDAFLVSPQSPAPLAQGIQLALCASENMREKARQSAQTKFDLKRMLKEYKAVILRSL